MAVTAGISFRISWREDFFRCKDNHHIWGETPWFSVQFIPWINPLRIHVVLAKAWLSFSLSLFLSWQFMTEYPWLVLFTSHQLACHKISWRGVQAGPEIHSLLPIKSANLSPTGRICMDTIQTISIITSNINPVYWKLVSLVDDWWVDQLIMVTPSDIKDVDPPIDLHQSLSRQHLPKAPVITLHRTSNLVAKFKSVWSLFVAQIRDL